MVLNAQTRTWTSSDGKKTFKGEFVGIDGKTIKIKRGGKELRFSRDLLSSKDLEWIKSQEGDTSSAANLKAADPTQIKGGYTWSDEVNYEIYFKVDGAKYPSGWGRTNHTRNMRLYEYDISFFPPYPVQEDAGYQVPKVINYRLFHESDKSNLITPQGGVQAKQFEVDAKWLKNGGATFSYKHEIDLYQRGRLIAFDEAIELIKQKPMMEVTFQVKVKNKIFDKALYTKKMSDVKGLDLSQFDETCFTAPNLQPPPDLVDLVCRKVNSDSSTVVDVIKAIAEGVKKEFKYVNQQLYSKDLPYAYDKRKMNCSTIDALFKAFCSAKGIPVQRRFGLVIEFQSGSTVQHAGYRTWTECFVPEIGWVPVDVQAFILNPRLKKNFFGDLNQRDSIRLPVEGGAKSGAFLTGVFKTKPADQPVHRLAELTQRLSFVEFKVKRIKK